MNDSIKQKISKALSGRKKSPEHAEKCRVAAIGKKYGRPTPEKIERIRSGNVKHGKGKKVNWDIVDEIRMLFRIGKSRREIQEIFPTISKGIINDIIANRTWDESYHP